MEEERSYFRVVVKDAIQDLKNGKTATLFYKEQVEEVVKEMEKFIIKIKQEDDMYYLSNESKINGKN